MPPQMMMTLRMIMSMITVMKMMMARMTIVKLRVILGLFLKWVGLNVNALSDNGHIGQPINSYADTDDDDG